jgi:trk system potassium uptake protein TrkH
MKNQETMTGATRRLFLRGMFVRHGLLLILSSCFHIIMLFPQKSNQDVFGSQGILFLSFDYWLLATLSLGGLGFLLQNRLRVYRHAQGRNLSGTSGLGDIFYLSLFPLPLYLLTFPSNVFSALLGLGVCVIQGYYVILSDSDAKSRLQSWLLRQSRRELKMELLVTPELMLLSLMAMTGHLFLLLSHLLEAFEIAGMQANMLFVYAAVSLLLSLTLENNLCKFLARQAKDLTKAKTDSTRGWQLHLARSLPWTFWLGASLLPLALAGLLQPKWQMAAQWALFAHQLFAYLFMRKVLGRQNMAWKWLLENPGQMLVGSFIALIFCGAAFLNLPISSSNGESLGILNSLFTATSAVCVTGLSVLEVSSALSTSGKVALAVLIQLGGLGIMSLTTFIAMLLGRKLGLFGNAAMRQSIGEEHSRQARKILAVIVLGTFAVEGLGTALLSSFYRSNFGWDWPSSLGYGTFMSVSAFCNAGFSLHTGCVTNFVREPLVLMTLSALLVTGGLGFAVIINLCKFIFDRRKIPLGVYERVVLLTGILLFAAGFVLFFCFENEGLLSGLSLPDRLCNAWFNAVSPRTAGFSSLEMTELQSKSRVLLMTLMFIGGNSASTAGGVKVGTFALICITLHIWLKGQNKVIIGNRSIPQAIIQQASAVILLTIAIIVAGTLLLSVVMPQAKLEDIVFEVISAISTVGLSTGLTNSLNSAGKCLIIFLMFLGRVGPVTFLLTLRSAKSSNIEYPPTRFLIG